MGQKYSDKLEKVCVYLASILLGGILLYLLVMSMNSTSICYEGEKTYYLKDNPWRHIFLIAVWIGALWVIKNKFHISVSTKFLKIYLLSVSAAMVFFVVLTQLEPVSDQEEVMLAAKQFLMGNYSAWEPGGYACYFRHQNGIILITAGLLRLFGTYNYVGMQLFNAALLAISLYLVYRISQRCFGRESRNPAIAVAVFSFIPIWFYVTFIYGTLIGFAAMMAAFWFLFRYMEDGKWQDVIGTAFFMALAVTAKSNYYIMLIAAGIVLFIKLFSEKWKRALILILSTAVFVTGASKGVDVIIESHLGRELSEGQPAEIWVAMGLSEGWLAPGWINGMSDYVFRDSGFNREMTRWAARNYIRQFSERAKAEEQYAEKFFVKKTASQWNNPTFECFQLLEDRNTKLSVPVWLQRFINTGTFTNRILTDILNYVQTIILFGALLYLILSIRKIRIEELLFGIIFIGGFLFHLFWEACCTYTVPYFLLLIPYSVKGYSIITDKSFSIKIKEKKNAVQAVVPAVILGILIWRGTVYYAVFLPDDTLKYQQYLAELNTVFLKGGVYVITPANSDGVVIGLYDEEAPSGSAVGVVRKDDGRNQKVSLVKVREINDYDRYINHTSTYYIWLEENQFYFYADEYDNIICRKLEEKENFLWSLEHIREDLYYIYSADGRALEYSPLNGVLFLNQKDGSNKYQVWRISESN